MTENFISIDDYFYDLPEERIAKFPVEPRDSSKLLVYKNGKISENSFSNLTEEIPENSLLVFNNTKVIPARLFFKKPTGAIIEIFLLQPILPSIIVSQAMETTETCAWECMIGNKKKWKGETLEICTDCFILSAELLDIKTNRVQFSWKNTKNTASISFSEIVKAFGEMPLPPYMNRKSEAKDLESYQTVYSIIDGAVAAPTAGLHFTESVFEKLKQKNIQTDFLTLHVGAGTFQPVKTENALEHTMHCEQIVFSKAFIERLRATDSSVIPVGTTSMRSLESLFWFGVKLHKENERKTPFFIEKLFPYHTDNKVVIDKETALISILNYMEVEGIETLIGETEIYIFEGYTFRMCQGIITNFHQPRSTLLLLISALVGKPWRTIYAYALTNDFRFLSYGDSSLLLPS